MVRIPSEYQEVEWVGSTDDTGQYINSGVNVSDTIIVKTKFNFPSKKSYASAFGGKYNEFCLSRYQNREYFVVQIYGSSTNITNFGYSQDKWIDVELSTTQCLLNGTLFQIQKGTSVSSSSIWLFGKANSKGTTLDVKNACKISYFQIFDGNVLVRNFIPCYRKSDNEIGMYDTVSKHFFTNSGTGTFLKGNDVTYDNINLLESRRRILLNTPHIETVSDTIASFKTDIATKLKECKIHFTPIQEGEGVPSPDNVRPIHGWDGVTVTACGKNLAHFDQEEMISAGWNRAFPNPFKKAGRYIISCQNEIVNGSTKGALFVLANNVAANPFKALTTWAFGNSTSGQMERAIDISEGDTKYNCIVLRFNAPPSYQSIINAQIQIEENSSATEYEPYTETSITIPFPQTIYGGYVDLVKGEVVEEWGEIALDGNNILGLNAWGGKGIFMRSLENGEKVIPFVNSQTNATFCNMLTPIGAKFKLLNNGTISIIGEDKIPSFTYIILYEDSFGETVEDYQITLQNLYNSGTPVKVVSRLKTAYMQTYPFTPQTLKALRGMNNIWSDANGNIEVNFYTH